MAQLKTKYKIMYSMLLLLIGYLSIGIGFALAVGACDQIPKAMLVSGIFLFFSFFTGNGLVWLLLSSICMYFVLRGKWIGYAFSAQIIISFSLGFSIGMGWILCLI